MNKPTIKDCFEYSNNMEQSVAFVNHFESIDWLVGRKGNAKPMCNWRSALTGWIKRSKPKQSNIEKAVSNTGSAIINKLWVRMTQIYGHKWTSNYGPEPTKPWVDVIAHLNNEQIAHGLKIMVKRVDKWPPDLVEFSQLCRSGRKQTALPNYRTKTEVLALRNQTKHARNNAMSEIRGIL